MVTIAGNGMGAYTFEGVRVDTEAFDVIVCDRNFTEEGDHILKLGYRDAKAYLLEHYADQNILYVVTGSPLFFSAAPLIARALPEESVQFVDHTSSLSYLLSHMHIAQNDVGVLSLHGRSRIDLEVMLAREYTFILCDAQTPARLAEAMRYLPEDAVEITIGYKLGYEDEVIGQVELDRIEERFDLSQPYVLLLRRTFAPRTPISKDTDLATERGMITKRYKRHFALNSLDLSPNHIMWDVGAGSGSCAIDAYKRYRVKTVLFEKQPQRCDYIRQNLREHFVIDTVLHEGEAEKLFESEPTTPDRICVGGGGSAVIARLPYLYARLADEGIMLIHAITLANLSEMVQALDHAGIAYEMLSFSLTTYKGRLKLVEPERQLFQIRVVKGG